MSSPRFNLGGDVPEDTVPRPAGLRLQWFERTPVGHLRRHVRPPDRPLPLEHRRLLVLRQRHVDEGPWARRACRREERLRSRALFSRTPVEIQLPSWMCAATSAPDAAGHCQVPAASSWNPMYCSTRQDATASVGDHEVPPSAVATSFIKVGTASFCVSALRELVGDQGEVGRAGEHGELLPPSPIGASGACARASRRSVSPYCPCSSSSSIRGRSPTPPPEPPTMRWPGLQGACAAGRAGAGSAACVVGMVVGGGAAAVCVVGVVVGATGVTEGATTTGGETFSAVRALTAAVAVGPGAEVASDRAPPEVLLATAAEARTIATKPDNCSAAPPHPQRP